MIAKQFQQLQLKMAFRSARTASSVTSEADLFIKKEKDSHDKEQDLCFLQGKIYSY